MTGRKGKIKSTRVTAAIEADDLEFLKRLAEEKDRSLSWIVSKAVRFYVEEKRKGSQLILDFERDTEGT